MRIKVKLSGTKKEIYASMRGADALRCLSRINSVAVSLAREKILNDLPPGEDIPKNVSNALDICETNISDIIDCYNIDCNYIPDAR